MRKPFVTDFRVPDTLDELAQSLGINPVLFSSVVNASDRSVYYRELHLSKKNPASAGDYRKVFSIRTPSLGDAHKAAARRLERFVRDIDARYPHPACHGYVAGRSTRTNAEVHCGARFILHADIEEFFDSITEGTVQGVLLYLGMKQTAAVTLASFLTINGRLPLGLHSSPLIANLVCLELDDRMMTLARRYHANYTRYADDMTLSSNSSRLPSRNEIESILQATGFRLSKRKFFMTKLGQSHFVTGLSVSDKVPHIPRKMKRRLRQEIYLAKKYGLQSHIARCGYLRVGIGARNVSGRLHYLAGVEHDLGNSMLTEWNKVLEENHVSPTFFPRFRNEVRSVWFYCDETEFPTTRGVVYAVALVAVEELGMARDTTAATIRSIIADPFVTGRKDRLVSQGLHFAEATEEVRSAYVKALADIPFRAYIAFDLLSNTADRASEYLGLLSALIRDRLIACDRAVVTMLFEENPSVDLKDLNSVVLGNYDALARSDSRRPTRAPDVKKVRKADDSLLAIPDFVLGVFGAYMAKHRDIDVSRFERLRDRYRLIFDKVNRKYYSRFKPFTPWEESDGVAQ